MSHSNKMSIFFASILVLHSLMPGIPGISATEKTELCRWNSNAGFDYPMSDQLGIDIEQVLADSPAISFNDWKYGMRRPKPRRKIVVPEMVELEFDFPMSANIGIDLKESVEPVGRALTLLAHHHYWTCFVRN